MLQQCIIETQYALFYSILQEIMLPRYLSNQQTLKARHVVNKSCKSLLDWSE